jgi:ribonuclease BN (tRNA processing enzyme)
VTLSVTALGTSGMFATDDVACSAYLIEWDGFKLWLDAGAGTWQRLLTVIDYRELSGILLTHRHPDHTTDVFQALHARYLGTHGKLAPIPLWAPQETLDLLVGFDEDMAEAFELRSVTGSERLDLNGASVSFVTMAHPPETLGVRIEGAGRVVSFSADSGPDADFPTLVSGADLFLCEATLQPGVTWEGHLNGAQAGALGAALGAGRTLLTHLPPERDHSLTLEEARAAAPGSGIELAEQGRRYEI